jgi:hypothetical protein
MKANFLRLEHHLDNSAGPVPFGWDAYTVWRERVRNAARAMPSPAPSKGWDPYLVWLSRVKKG